jgi:hypothetical protein
MNCGTKMKKSPLKQEDPKSKPTYSNMPTSKRSGFKDRPYTATKKDSADYRAGFYNPGALSSSRIKNAGRIEAIKAKKSPLKQEDPKKTPYIPGRVSKEVRDAANTKKAAAREIMSARFEKGAASKGMTTKEYSKYLDKEKNKKSIPAGNPRTSGAASGGKGSGAKCPTGPGGY